MTVTIDPALSEDEIAAVAEEAYLYATEACAYGFFHRQVAGPARAGAKRESTGFTHFRRTRQPDLNTRSRGQYDTLLLTRRSGRSARRAVLCSQFCAFEISAFHDIQAKDWYTMCFRHARARATSQWLAHHT